MPIQLYHIDSLGTRKREKNLLTKSFAENNLLY